MKTDYLLDTNACIAIRELLKGSAPKDPGRAAKLQRLKARWAQVDPAQLHMSVITLGELRYGAEKSANPVKAKHLIAQVQARLKVLPLDGDTAEHYGDIRAGLEKQGQTIGPNDLWIAAHGRASQCTVVTNNTGEFARVPGLSTEDWSA